MLNKGIYDNINLGETLYGLKKYEEAIESYLSITKIDLTNSKANKCLGTLFWNS